MIERVVVAYGDDDVARARTYGLGSQFRFQLEIELIHLNVSCAAAPAPLLRNCEHHVKQNGKGSASHRGDGLGEQVYDGDQEQHQGDQSKSHGNLHATEREIQWNLKFPLPRACVAKNENCKAVHRETPDHAESVEVREKGNVAAADDDGDDLQRHDDIDDAIARTEALVRLTEPGAEHAVFRNAVQHTVRTYDGGIDCTREDQGAHHDNKTVEYQTHDKWPFKIHRQPADQVFEVVLADVVRNDHHGKEGDQRGKDQTVDKNYRAGLFQV